MMMTAADRPRAAIMNSAVVFRCRLRTFLELADQSRADIENILRIIVVENLHSKNKLSRVLLTKTFDSELNYYEQYRTILLRFCLE